MNMYKDNTCNRCHRQSLNGYEYCEKHIGEALRREQKQKEEDVRYYEAYANCYDE